MSTISKVYIFSSKLSKTKVYFFLFLIRFILLIFWLFFLFYLLILFFRLFLCLFLHFLRFPLNFFWWGLLLFLISLFLFRHLFIITVKTITNIIYILSFIWKFPIFCKFHLIISYLIFKGFSIFTIKIHQTHIAFLKLKRF